MSDEYDAKAREISNRLSYPLQDDWTEIPALRDLASKAIAANEIVISSALRSAAAEEREACAEIVDSGRSECTKVALGKNPSNHVIGDMLAICRSTATAIRSRGDSNLVQSDDVPDQAQCDHLMKENAGPTQWAYDAACKALHAHRERADKAEARLADMNALAGFLADRLTEFEGDMCDCMTPAREWMGHVSPALERMKIALASDDSTEPHQKQRHHQQRGES